MEADIQIQTDGFDSSWIIDFNAIRYYFEICDAGPTWTLRTLGADGYLHETTRFKCKDRYNAVHKALHHIANSM